MKLHLERDCNPLGGCNQEHVYKCRICSNWFIVSEGLRLAFTTAAGFHGEQYPFWPYCSDLCSPPSVRLKAEAKFDQQELLDWLPIYFDLATYQPPKPETSNVDAVMATIAPGRVK